MNLTLVLDPLYVLTPPKRSESIWHSLWMKLTASLATRFDTTAQTIRRLIPKEFSTVGYTNLTVGMLFMLMSLTHPYLIAVTCHLSGYVYF
jgi:hypothetical protein